MALYDPIIIKRERDGELLDVLLADPAVRPFVKYDDAPIDWYPVLRPASGVVVLSNGEDAAAGFELTADREWQTHTFFGPTCRGRRALDTARAILEWMRPYADRIWGYTPIANPQARWFNRQMGAKVIGTAEMQVEGPAEIFEFRF